MRRPALALALVALATAHVAAAGPLMAVDLGGEYMKIAVVTQGSRSPVQVVTNEMSRRRTAAAVSYAADGGRLIGDDAAAAATRRPATTVVRLRPLLGVNASDVAPNPSNAALTIKPFGERGSAGVSVRPKTVVPAEELAASLLHHARRLAEATLGDGARVRDAVVTVPPGAPPALRAALADAAAATNLTLLTLVSSPAAAALAYGIERKWAPTATRVLFYEQGSTRTAAALVDFRSTGGPAGAGSFAIVDVAWADLGSDALDGLLFERAADAFAAAHPSAPSIRADPRAAARLRVAVRRTKEILSANADAPVSVEEVVGGIDLRLTITRAELEADAAAAGFFDAAVAPVATLLKEHKVKPAALAAVELVGGGTRVPGLQAALVKVLGGRKLDRHMDADEAVLHGAALFGANASTAFRLRKFGGADVAPFSIALTTTPINAAGAAVGGATPLPKPLLPFGWPLPARRVAKLTPVKGADGFSLNLAYDAKESKRGVPGVRAGARPSPAHLAVGAWTVTGLTGALADAGGPQRVEVTFASDADGRLAPARADAVAEVEETYEVKIPVAAAPAPAPAANDTASTNATTTPAPPEPTYTTEKRTRTRVARAPLTVRGALAAPRLPPADAATVGASLAAAAAADGAAAAAAAAKNGLEAFILASRAKLDAAAAAAETDAAASSSLSSLSDDDDAAFGADLAAVSTPDERGGLAAALTEAEDWLYDDGEGEGADAFAARRAALADAAAPLFLRASERRALPATLDAAAATAAAAAADAKAWKKARPWLPSKEVDALASAAASLSKLVAKDGAAARKAPPTSPPKLLSSDVAARAGEVERERARLGAVEPPPPPPSKKEDAAKKEGSAPSKKAKKDGAGGAGGAPAPAPAAADDGDGSHDEL